MTPGNNGASTPEDDDPFGYLYADGQASGATPPTGGGGYGYPGPRSSYNQVRAVGERQYGQQAAQGHGQQTQQAPYGQVPQQPSYGQQNAHYAAPETLPGGAPTTQYQPMPDHGRGGRGRGPNTKGLLIGAIAVVAAVVIGIGVAVFTGDDSDNSGDNQAGGTPAASKSAEPSQTATENADAPAELPLADAKALKLEGGAVTASAVKGAEAGGGVYVEGLNQVGAQATWTVNGIPKNGVYTLFVGYSVPGEDAKMTLTVNGKVFGTKLNMGNFAKAAQGDWEKGWTQTFAYPSLTKGTNTITISCQAGDQCNALLDRVWLKAGQVKK
ncbi:carbohydrate-binding protein [Streptomyces sp. NPDC002896]|uniref:carbohydrate-binding protein n=1 Tax=Streptomyces sp. NPDC002896 TaxID=3154438 RepID=UPI0033199278